MVVIALHHRHREVLRLAASGAQTKQMAAEMNYSVNTIKMYRHEVVQILGAKNLTHAVATAIRWNLI